jgi:hypothetical protein
LSALTHSRRRRIVGALIVLLLLWPLVQQQLVRVYRVDPWKLAGWAMYSVPSAWVRIQLIGLDANERTLRIDPKSSAALKMAVLEFGTKRRRIGLFVEPMSIATTLLKAFPDHREWTVVVDQVGLTSRNFFGVIHRSEYRYVNVAGEVKAVASIAPEISL